MIQLQKKPEYDYIGLNDTEKHVQVTREAFEFLKNFHPYGSGSINKVPIKGYTGFTYTLSIIIKTNLNVPNTMALDTVLQPFHLKIRI